LIEHKPAPELSQTSEVKKNANITKASTSDSSSSNQPVQKALNTSEVKKSEIPVIPKIPSINALQDQTNPIIKAETVIPSIPSTVDISSEERGEPTIDVELQNTPSVSSLDALLAKAKATEVALTNQVKKVDVTIIKEIWETYKEEATMPSIKSVLNKVHLKVENEVLQIILPSVISKEMVQQEIKLIQNIRSSLNNFDLVIDFIIDKEAFPQDQVDTPKKYLSFKEKFELMNKKNPQLTVLIKTLELKRDHNNS